MLDLQSTTGFPGLEIVPASAATAQQRKDISVNGIVNIINFIRGVEPRNPGLDLVLPVQKQLEVTSELGLPATWLLQYDALIDDRFISVLRKALAGHEIGAWLEIPEPLVRAAGLIWRGRFPWDWECQVDFTISYTPTERERLCDAYMSRFHETFGRYPSSIGSWVLDAHTIAYLREKYGIVAACICKDQRGTDGYTLWGGYYNQAYYPSRKNMYMPAQHIRDQISVPVFRMLGSDPIYQYSAGEPGQPQSVVSLEPVYPEGGGNPDWVRWFFKENFERPSLSFGYAQAGQENSFGWQAMSAGFTDQCHLMLDYRKRGLRVETLSESGRWFQGHYNETPASAITALDDWQGKGRASVWYCSKAYRVNLFQDAEKLYLRDVHWFNEQYAEPHLIEPCRTSSCRFDTLPVFDGGSWAGQVLYDGITPVQFADGAPVPLAGGPLSVSRAGKDTLSLAWPAADGHPVQVDCRPSKIAIDLGGVGRALVYPLPTGADTAIHLKGAQELDFEHHGFRYKMVCRDARIELSGDRLLLIKPQRTSVTMEFLAAR
jgi:hypothetical protein